MVELDLHNVRHDDVRKKLDRIINLLWLTNEELHIITGHSVKMKEIVLDILHEYKLDYSIGGFEQKNMGFIRTYLD